MLSPAHNSLTRRAVQYCVRSPVPRFRPQTLVVQPNRPMGLPQDKSSNEVLGNWRGTIVVQAV